MPDQTPSLRGAFLRRAGVVVAVIGVLVGFAGAFSPAPTGQVYDFSIAALWSSIVTPLFRGGLLWAAGTVVGQLDAIRER